MTSIKLQCAGCSLPLSIPHGSCEFSCSGCGMLYTSSNNYLQYYPHQLLLDRFSKKYVRNRVLNNNAELVYRSWQTGSLSTEDRDDVRAFSSFVLEHMKGDTLLDIGCGPLALPAYLQGPKNAGVAILGLDPIPSHDFEGFRIVGCSEFMPLPSRSINTAIFATSLDHVVDLEATIEETKRVLNSNGRVLVWMGDQYRPWWKRFLSYAKSMVLAISKGYPDHRYKLFSPDIVVYVPAWAVDPFHSYYESPLHLVKIMEKHGFRRIAYDYRRKDEVFICFAAT